MELVSKPIALLNNVVKLHGEKLGPFTRGMKPQNRRTLHLLNRNYQSSFPAR